MESRGQRGGAGGARLLYNPRFSRSRPAARRSYSVPLRPDIALAIPSGPHAGLHLFDAKFRLERLAATFAEREDTDDEDAERAEERRGTFKRADLYKMHTYRDAILDARSIWILYPGTEFRHFVADPRTATAPTLTTLGAAGIDGVGAIPLAPDEAQHMTLDRVLDALLCLAECNSPESTQRYPCTNGPNPDGVLPNTVNLLP